MKRMFAIGFIIIFGTLWYITDRENKALATHPPVKIKLEKKAPEVGLKLSKMDMDCLAKNVYFEARSESVAGGVMVAMVTLNRMQSKRFPNSVCKVVTQGYRPGKRNCTFSWFCDGLEDTPKDMKAWSRSYQIAEWTSKNYFSQEKLYTAGADHYHTHNVNPYWNEHMKVVKVEGNHIFYRGA